MRAVDAPLLEVSELYVTFRSPDGLVHAVRGVSFSVDAGEVLGIVGESGSGKSVSLLAVMGLLPASAQVSGSIRYRGRELIGMPESQRRRLRGSDIAMIFQDPMSALNPVLSVGFQIAEAVEVHQPGIARDAAMAKAEEMLDLVGIPNAADRARQFPHEFSGGMLQRAMIGMAIANNPGVLIADEPTTALDVTIQAQILELLERVQDATGSAILLITHDLGIVAGIADRITVMYAGRVVETGGVFDVFGQPRHPYTLGLLESLPRLDESPQRRLVPIGGNPPSLIHPPPACPFHPRCRFAEPVCSRETPALRPIEGSGQQSACHFAERLAEVGPS